VSNFLSNLAPIAKLDDAVNGPEVWQAVMNALKTRTGLPVKYLRLDETKDQLEALRNGALHVTAFGSGAVPAAVNTCGFTPVCTFGRADGGYGCNLSPELREAIREALLGLPWSGTKLEKEFGGDAATKFVAITYKDDWANIRRVDEAAANAREKMVVAR